MTVSLGLYGLLFYEVLENHDEGCQCSLDNSCDSRYNDNNLCNCDDRDIGTDVGILSSRDQLPVTQLAFGDSEHRYSFIHYTLGDLVCYGKRGLYPSEADNADFLFKASFTGSSYITSGSKNALDFRNILFGNELGSWNGTAFVAPVDGIYALTLQITTRSKNRGYRLRALINNGEVGIDQLTENSSINSSNSRYGHNHSFQIEREMQRGDTMMIIDEYASYELYDYNENKCSTNQQDHSCSYITGRLIKRLK